MYICFASRCNLLCKHKRSVADSKLLFGGLTYCYTEKATVATIDTFVQFQWRRISSFHWCCTARSLPLNRAVQLLTKQKQKNLFEVCHASPTCFSSKSVVEDGRGALVE